MASVATNIWGQSRAEQQATFNAAHMASHPAETGGWRRPVRVAPPSVSLGALAMLSEPALPAALPESPAGPRPPPTIPTARRCAGGITALRTFADYRARLGSAPVAAELEEAWLSSEVWSLCTGAEPDVEEVGAYAVDHDSAELTLFYLCGPSARHGEAALLHAVAVHRITRAVVSTTDSFVSSLLMDLELTGLAPRTQVFCYGGTEPRFSLLPKIQWPASPRGYQLGAAAAGGSLAGLESGSAAAVRPATGSDCGRLATLLGEVLPEFSRRVAANQLLVAVLPRADRPDRIVGAGWWVPSLLDAAQEEADRKSYSSRSRARARDIDPMASIQVFVGANHRRKGVGCSLVTAVVQAARRTGHAPVAGCTAAGDAEEDSTAWKSVLEAGGMVSLARLVDFTLAS